MVYVNDKEKAGQLVRDAITKAETIDFSVQLEETY